MFAVRVSGPNVVRQQHGRPPDASGDEVHRVREADQDARKVRPAPWLCNAFSQCYYPAPIFVVLRLLVVVVALLCGAVSVLFSCLKNCGNSIASCCNSGCARSKVPPLFGHATILTMPNLLTLPFSAHLAYTGTSTHFTLSPPIATCSDVDVGNVVTIAMNDAQRMLEAGSFASHFVMGPAAALGVVIVLLNLVGVSVLAGVAAMLALIPLQRALAKAVGKVNAHAASHTARSRADLCALMFQWSFVWDILC